MSTIIVFGGSGVIGRGVLEAASADAGIGEIRALQRRPVEPPLDRVHLVRVENFADLSAHRDSFRDVDACIFALGISQTLVSSDEEYRRITVEFALEAARRLAEESPKATFLYVSGMGADPTERSRVLFARVKGEAENLLRREPVGRLVIARPGSVVADFWPRRPKWYERLLLPVIGLVTPFLPGFSIRSRDLGRALLRAALDPSIPELLDNRALRGLVERHGQRSS